MGIIVSTFRGCGRSFFTELYRNKVKVFDKHRTLGNDELDEIMNVLDDYDIVFVDSSSKTREMLEDRNIDYDVFYPSKDRRGEFIENEVRKRSNPKEIQELDRYFDEWVDDIDDDDSENCHKHKLDAFGHFIGNNAVLMQYVTYVMNNKEEKQTHKENDKG